MSSRMDYDECKLVDLQRIVIGVFHRKLKDQRRKAEAYKTIDNTNGI